VQYALAKFGIEAVAEQLTHFVGPPLHRSFMTSYGFNESVARQAVEYYREYFSVTGIHENVLLPEIPSLLGALRAEGRHLSVVTSKPAFYAEQIVRHFGLDGFFEAVIGAEMDLTNTEKAVLVNLALERFGEHARTDAVMIGDREHDVIGARANGIDSIAVTYGAGSGEELTAAAPTRIVDSVGALAAALGL
jgi:phosphoglycolate phosphatase